jgi:hypothetical protein
VDEHFGACFAARDWDGTAEMLADDTSTDDRRRTVNSGIRHGRDPVIASMRAIAEVGVTNGTSAVIATRGDRLALSHIRMSGHDQAPEAFHIDMLGIVEINADERIAARVTFDVDDIDAAFEELDARYLAGEAAARAPTWSVISGAYAALNRRELPGTTADWVNLDHRRFPTIEAGRLTANIRASWDLTPDVRNRIEAVHRLSNLGAVVTSVAYGTSREGFDAEWREIEVDTVKGDLINRCEKFDETDIDVALARFDELTRSAPRRLENTASQVFDSFRAYFATRDWTAMAEILAEHMCNDDRRRVVGAQVLHGRETDIAHMRAIADVGANTITSNVIATRGEHLVLSRVRFSGEDQRPDAFYAELLGIVEVDADERIVARVSFDADDIDAAFAELDARYAAGQAAAHAQTWSAVMGAYASFNRRELPATTPDWLNIDHRRGAAFAPGDVIPYIRTAWDVAPDISIFIAAVHRLSDAGAVVTYAANGTSGEGFDAEWREITLLTFEGDLISRCEIFDEADLDTAVARFDDLNPA